MKNEVGNKSQTSSHGICKPIKLINHLLTTQIGTIMSYFFNGKS